ncbi:MAG TPA: PilN domain-containing protein [Pyrinomonadaceae bacterium]|jgi:Tfp pilus assembly protein PilN
MIKVNLLDSVTDRAKGVAAVEERVANPRTQTMMLGLIVAGLLTLAMGYDYYSSRKDLDAAKQALATQQAINTQMIAVNKEKDELEKKTKDIQVRIDAIQKLRASQQGPGNVLRSVKERIDSIPGLYLESVEQKGGELTIKGSSPNESSVTRFGQSMEFSAGLFSNLSIETKREEVKLSATDAAAPTTDANGEPIKGEAPEVVNFTIKCSYTPSAPESQSATPAAAVPATNQIAQK